MKWAVLLALLASLAAVPAAAAAGPGPLQDNDAAAPARGVGAIEDVLAFDPRELPTAEVGRWEKGPESEVDERAAALAGAAEQAYRGGDLPRAIELASAALEREPDFPPALQVLGTVLFRLQRYGDAAVCFERFVGHMPDEVWRTQALGHCYYSLGRYEDAREHYDRVLAEVPDGLPPGALAEARRGRGLALYRLGEIEPALEELREVVQLRPDHDEAWQWIGQLEYEEGRFEEALLALDRAAELARHDPRVWFLRGKVLTALGREEDAERARARFEDLDAITQEIRSLRAGLRLDPRNYPEAMRLVELCKTVGDLGGVREAMELVVLARPENVRELQVHVFALRTFLRLGDLSAAATAAQALETCCSDDPAAWKALQDYFARIGDTPRQVEAGEKYRRLRSR